jgi:hypothetical protein
MICLLIFRLDRTTLEIRQMFLSASMGQSAELGDTAIHFANSEGIR